MGALLLLALGFARGVGGLWLVRYGAGALGPQANAKAPATLLGIGLIVVGLLCIGFGVVIWRGIGHPTLWGLVPLGAFVAGGLANGYALWGQPRPAGTAANVIYSAVVVALLWWGERRTRRSRKNAEAAQQSDE
jgi:hypothetical protein